MHTAIRKLYDSQGVDGYYSNNVETYENPHSKFALDCLENQWNSKFESVLDFACGNGLIAKHLLKNKMAEYVIGCDKFMSDRFSTETGLKCYSFSFEEVSTFSHNLPKVDIIVISYAIDLVPKSYLNKFLYALSSIGKNLLIIRPNSHDIDSDFWQLESVYKSGKAKSFLYSSKI